MFSSDFSLYSVPVETRFIVMGDRSVVNRPALGNVIKTFIFDKLKVEVIAKSSEIFEENCEIKMMMNHKNSSTANPNCKTSQAGKDENEFLHM